MQPISGIIIFFDKAPVYGRCPDYKIGAEYWEMKRYESKHSKNTISTIIRRNCNTETRLCDRLIIKLNEEVPEQTIRNKVKDELKANKKASWYKEIVVIDGNGNVYKCK